MDCSALQSQPFEFFSTSGLDPALEQRSAGAGVASASVLFLSKAPYIFMQTMHCAQVCISHLSQSDRRSEALGRLGMSYGAGMVAGDVLGGFLGS